MMLNASEHDCSPLEHSLNKFHSCKRATLCFTNAGRKSSHDWNRKVNHGVNVCTSRPCWSSASTYSIRWTESCRLSSTTALAARLFRANGYHSIGFSNLLEAPCFQQDMANSSVFISGFPAKTEKAKCVVSLGDRCQRVSKNCSQLEKMTEIKKCPFNNRGLRKPWVR